MGILNTPISELIENARSKKDNEFKEVVRLIRDFKPFGRYDFEQPYQGELAQWLKGHFKNTQIEVQRGASRPDIVVNGIAIEVKGPTSVEALNIIGLCQKNLPETLQLT